MSYRRRYLALALAMAGVSALALGAGARTFAAPVADDAAPVADDAAPASTVYLPMVRTPAAPTVAFTTLSDHQLGDQARNPSDPATLYDISLLSGPQHQVKKVLSQQDVLVPGWSGDGSYFFQYGGLNYSVNLASTTVYTLPSSVTSDWEPGGSRLLYTKFQGSSLVRTSFLSNADGSGVVQLLPDMPQVISAQWSPDGTKILAEVPSDVLYHNDCYLLDADGTMIRKIATIPAIYVYWTPDGSKIFYFAPDENLVGRLWVQPVDGSQAKQISPLDASGAIEFTYEWSPDGRYVAYDDHVNGLWVTDADGVIQYQSTATNTTRLVWSPDSSKLAYVTTVYDSTKLESSTLWSVDVASASLQQLAVHSEPIRGNYDTWDEFPMWTDDSSTLVYLGSASNTLFAVPAAGGVDPSAIVQSVMLLIGSDSDGALLFSLQVGEQYTITRSRVDGSEAEDLALLDKRIWEASITP